jgi:hypothetical protein
MNCQYVARWCGIFTYILAKQSSTATDIFIFQCICKSWTMKAGKMPKVQSDIALMAEWAYVELATATGSMQCPGRTLLQKYDIGWH